MAYTVGSASVDIVPDFKNAQLAITAFFNKQKNELRIPVKVDLDQSDTANVERQAREVGSKVSKAMADGAARNQASADRLALQMAEGAERSKLQAHAAALRMNAQMDREAAKASKALLDEETKARIEAERLAEQMSEGRSKARLQAHAEALRINAQFDRENETRARQQARAEELALQKSLRTAEAVAAQRRKIEDQAAAEGARRREQTLREEERFFQDQIKAQIRALKLSQKDATASEKLRIQVEIDQQQAILEGRRTGGLITRSIHAEIKQNAGLISAVIAGALIAGAPAAIGGAVALFGGIAAVAAAQSQKVRTAYIGLWSEIKSGTISDSASLIPVFERTAGIISQSFQRIRPAVRDAFEASGPYITSFVSSLTQASENALPGIVRAVQTAGPVVSGLGQLLEKTGSGVSEFFDVLSTRAPAAGEAASDLGDSVRALLPAVAELLGAGAQTATIVLPAVTAAFQAVHSVASGLNGVLPQLLTSFLAFRAVQGVGRIISNVSANFAGWSVSAGKAIGENNRLTNGLSRASSVLSGLGKAVPFIGIAFAAFAADAARTEQQVQKMTQAILANGQAAASLKAQVDRFGDNSSFGGALREQYAEAKKGADDYLRSLTPLERAQNDLQVATRNLQTVMGDESSTASDLRSAKEAVARAAARQAAEEDKLAIATRGVTEAMAEQADAARARVDESFAYQQSLIDIAKAQQDAVDSQTALDEARASGDTEAIAAAELDLREALLGVNMALSDRVSAAQKVAAANLPAALEDDQVAILAAKGALDEMNKMISEGITLPPEMEQYRQSLIDITGAADGSLLAQAQLAAALGEVGAAVTSIPGTATVRIDAPTDEVKQRLLDLGFTVELMPDGDIKVTAITEEAKANLGTLSTDLANLDATTATPTAALNSGPFQGIWNNVMGSLGVLGVQKPTPVAGLNSSPYQGVWNNVMGSLGVLGVQRPTPTVTAIDNASGIIGTILGGIARVQDKTVTITTRFATVGSPPPVRGSATYDFAEGGAIPVQRMATGNVVRAVGPIIGRGGPWDDLVDIKASPGEHMLDAGDVARMGGHAGVYAFRDMLQSGYFGGPSEDIDISRMVATGPSPTRVQNNQGGNRDVRIYTQDNPRAIIRAMRAEEQQQAALAPVWT